jgi:hypothetical protein
MASTPSAAQAPPKTPPAAPPAPRLADPPDRAAIDAATALVRDLYKKEFDAAKTPAQRSDLAKILLKQAADSKSEPAGYFVLLEEARAQAVKGGDLITAFAAIDQLAAAFKVADLERRRDALSALSTTSPPPMQKQLAELALSLVDQAVEIDDYAIAKELATIGSASARKSKDLVVTRAATARATEVEKLAKEYTAVKEALSKLEKEPTDPQANLLAGKFYCFAKGNWSLGVSMLALSSDPSFKAQAEKDIAQPTTAVAQVAVGDGWWDLGEKQDALAKTQLQLRACEWYRQAVPGLSGLAKAKAEKRLADLSAELTKAGAKSTSGPSLPLLTKAQAAVKNAKTNKIAAHGFGLADTWEDLPEQGGLLVGLDVGLTANGDSILALQPIYATQRGEVRGRAYGKPEQGAQAVRIKAKNGYAIGAVQLRAGLFLDGIAVTFMQIQGDRLNPEMNYASEAYGAKGGGDRTLSLPGEPIIGLHGHIAKDGRLHSLGVITTPAGAP